MEKLRPVLKQIFWICTGLVVLFAVSGWWLATGSLLEQIRKDKAKLTTAMKDATSGAEAPNAVFTKGAKLINEKHQAEFEQAEQELHARQIKYRTYPESIAAELPHVFGAPIAETALRRQYGKLYNLHFTEQLRVLDPFIVQDNKGMIAVSVEGITKEDVGKWHYNPPTASEIWNAQEDLWLLRSLFESIAKVNRESGADRLAESPVRQLLTLYLRGGDRVPAGTTGAAGGMRGGGSFGSRGSYEEDEGDGVFGPSAVGTKRGGGAAGRAGGGRSNAGAAFAGNFGSDLLAEEFGQDTSGYGLGRTGGARGSFAEDEGDGVFGGGRSASRNAGPAGAPGAGGGRYVDDAAEYRTRAFLLHVKVEPEYIPALLTELTNSSFPVEIVRVDTNFASGGRMTSGGMGRGSRANDYDDSDYDDGDGGSGFGRMMGGRAPGGLLGAGRGGTSGGLLGAGRRGAGVGGGRRGGTPGPRAGSGIFLQALASKEYNPIVAEKGQAQLLAATSDPLLAELQIAGLLTVYRTKEENKTVEETEEMEAQEAEAAETDPSAPSAEEDAAAETAAGADATALEGEPAAGDDPSVPAADASALGEDAADERPVDGASSESGAGPDPTGE